LLYNQSAAKAEKLVQESKVLVTPGSTLVIEPQGAEYAPFFARQKARMNLVVMLPADRALDVELETKNGDIAAEAVAIDDMFLASTLNGDIAVRDLNGLVDVKTENGDVELRRIGGPVRVKTLNGEIEVEDVAGNAVLETSNGDVEALFVRGSVEAETRNGDVKLTEIPEAVMVKTYNGDIEVSTSRVGGDWVIETRNGTVELELPADGDYTVEADTIYGDVETNVPGLTTTKHRITGVVGTGEHLLNIATNSDIDIVAKPGY
jgi:DUF4097 and DUF4098 domain-containing protein YvlB